MSRKFAIELAGLMKKHNCSIEVKITKIGELDIKAYDWNVHREFILNEDTETVTHDSLFDLIKKS